MFQQQRVRVFLSGPLSFLFAVTGVGIWRLTAQDRQVAAGSPSGALSQAVGPFLVKNCQTCHNTAFASGNLDMQQLLAMPDSLDQHRDSWEDIAYKIKAGEMPPKGTAQPPKEEMDAALEVISRALAANPATAAPANIVQTMAPATNDWSTFGYDPQRTNWARGETKISKETAPKLQLKWRLQTDTVPNPVDRYSTMTAPIVIPNVQTKDGPKTMMYVGSHDNTLYAIDADKGTIVWTRAYPNTVKAKVAASGNCPNNMNATPVVDKSTGILYFLPNDGKLRGVNLTDGEDRFPATSIVPPYTRNFSLNMIDGVIFTSTARGCQNEISEVVGIDTSNPDHPISHFYTSTGKASGPWGRGGMVVTPFGVLAQTADGAYDPAAGRWGSTVVGLNKFGRVTDSFTPINQFDLDARDFDLGSSSPVVFPFGDRTLVAVAAKEGVIYLLDAKNLGGKDHRTPLYTSPRWSNDSMQFSMNGMWSVMSTWQDAQGKRWLLAPFYGPEAKATAGLFPKTHGPTTNGQLMAFTVEGTGAHPTLKPQWMSADLDLPGVAVVANGVILILANGDRGSTLIPGGRGGGRGPAPGAEDDVSAAGAGGGRGGRGGAPAAADAANPAGGAGPGRGAGPVGPGAGGADPAGGAPATAGRGGGGGAGRGGFGRGGAPPAPGAPRVYNQYEVNPAQPGFERDAAWRASQLRPFEEGGQKGGQRYSGGRDTTHAVLYALDPATGDEIYSSGDAIDSWNHYGEISIADGNVYISTWDARIYAFGLKK